MTAKVEEEFFEGFSWALLHAFAESLGACRFEQGDTLYDTRIAYVGTWGEALPHIKYSIQVKSPSRGTVTKTEKNEESVFTDNWNQTVVFNFTDYNKKESKEFTATQGRLYTLLWKGDLKYLDKETADPPIPTLGLQIVKRFSQADGRLKEIILKERKSGTAFFMPYDQTHQLLRTKFRKVKASLDSLDAQLNFISPGEAGLTLDTVFAPTVSLACFYMEDASRSTVENAIKKALYVPAKDKKTDKETFRVSSHGHVVSI